jgi:hypothetical protein
MWLSPFIEKASLLPWSAKDASWKSQPKGDQVDEVAKP